MSVYKLEASNYEGFHLSLMQEKRNRVLLAAYKIHTTKILSFADRILATEAFFEDGSPVEKNGIPTRLDFFVSYSEQFVRSGEHRRLFYIAN